MNKKDKQTIREAQLGRRGFLRGASAAAAGLGLPGITFGRKPAAPAAPNAASGSGATHDTIIFAYMRGGMDGLSVVAPVGDFNYFRYRLASNPVAMTAGTDLDSVNYGMGYWRLAAAMSAVLPAWNAGDLAFLPGFGLRQKNQSHFVAQDLLEYGNPAPTEPPVTSITDGFMGRLLNSNTTSPQPPLRGLMMQKLATASYLKGDKSLAIPDVSDFGFPGDSFMRGTVAAVNSFGPDPIRDASSNSFDAIDYLDPVTGPPFRCDGQGCSIPGGDLYPRNEFGRQFRRAMDMLKFGNAPESIEIDLGGWDTHSNQQPNDVSGNNPATMGYRMLQLAGALGAFYQDLDTCDHPALPGVKLKEKVTVVVVSEFGRRLRENASGGTDHGWGGCVIAMGGRVNGRIYDDIWYQNGGMQSDQGLFQSADASGDLEVTADTDLRLVFSEVFTKQLNLSDPRLVYFNGFNYPAGGLGLIT